MTPRGASEREPVSREIDRLAETVSAREGELGRLEAELDELERLLGEKALEAADAEPIEETALIEVADVPDPVPAPRPEAATAAPPPPRAAPPASRIPAPQGVIEVRDPRLDLLTSQVDALDSNIRHLRALAANTDRKLDALAVAALDGDAAGDTAGRLLRARTAIVFSLVIATALLRLAVELAIG